MTLPASETKQMSHMPFLFNDKNQLWLVCCCCDETPRRVPQYSRWGATRVWKLYWMPFRDGVGILAEAKRIDTGLGDNEVECSPCVSRGGGNQLCLSFIATSGHGTGPLVHHLYRAAGPSLDRMDRPRRVGDEPCYAGFYRKDLTATASGRDGEVRLSGQARERLQTDFQEISRISFCYDQPSRLLITGVSKSAWRKSGPAAGHCTIVYDVEERRVVGQVECDGQPLYKPTICSGQIAYANEHRRVRQGWRLRSHREFRVDRTDLLVRAIDEP